MELQGDGKCCFCERKFESGNLGRYELDIEHFRPKGSIGNWPCPQSLIDDGVTLTTPPEANNGYYLLSYNLLNYAVACKPCNSGLKKRYFPIAGAYDADGDDPTEMTAEQPWLIYPIGSLDVDPEDVITFHGFLPQSNAAHPFLMLRGLVTIAFFGLDDVIGRKNLMRGAGDDDPASLFPVGPHRRARGHGRCSACQQNARVDCVARQLRPELRARVPRRPDSGDGDRRTRTDVPEFRLAVSIGH